MPSEGFLAVWSRRASSRQAGPGMCERMDIEHGGEPIGSPFRVFELEAWVDGFAFQGEHAEDTLMHLV